MAGDFLKEAMRVYNLEKVIEDLSIDAGETIRDLLVIYDRHYSEGSLKEEFIISCLTSLVINHVSSASFLARTDISESIKDRVIKVLVTRVYSTGKKWLVDRGFVYSPE